MFIGAVPRCAYIQDQWFKHLGNIYKFIIKVKTVLPTYDTVYHTTAARFIEITLSQVLTKRQTYFNPFMDNAC